MYNVSNEYLAAIRALSKTDRMTGTLRYAGGEEISLADALLRGGTVSISKQCVTGEELEYGTAIFGELDISLRTDQSRYAFSGAVVAPMYGVLLADGTWYDLPLGVYTVCETDRKNSIVELVAYDNLLNLDKDFDGVSIFGTPFEVMTEICEVCGVTFAHTEEEILAMPNGDQAIQIDSTSGCNTFRDCAKIVAQLVGAFVVADAWGRIALRQYSKAPVATLTKQNRVSTKLADYICQYAGLTIQSNKGKYSSYDTSFDSGLELTIPDAPAWDYGTDESLQARTDALLAELVQIRYTPGNLSVFGDPALECGDMVTLETDDGEVTTLITGYTWKFRGRMSVESIGKNPYLKSTKPQKTQIIRELEKQTTANKLIFYSFTNSADVVAEGTEIKPLASVTFVTVEDTSAMFLAQLPVTAAAENVVTTTEEEKAVIVKDATGAEAKIQDADGNPLTLTVVTANTDTRPGEVDLQIFYYMNGSLVEYQLIERLTAGPHILSLFYPFAELNGNTSNKFEVRILATGGSVTVSKRDFRATVTGQGLSATTVWDGTITVEEAVAPFTIRSKRMALATMEEEVGTATQVPAARSAVDVVSGGFKIQRKALRLAGMEVRFSLGDVVRQQTINDWNYAERYVAKIGNDTMIQARWNYQSKEQAVDQGRMAVVKAVTNDLASVEEVTVS